MAYLEGEGALCSIVGPNGAVIARSPEVTPPPPTLATPDDDFLSLQTPPPPSDASMQYESGLAAGFGSSAGAQDLGALDDAAASSGTLRLSMLDGENSEEKKGPAAGSVADTSNVAAFLPPDALQETQVELADERPEVPEPLYDAVPPPPGPEERSPVSFHQPATGAPPPLAAEYGQAPEASAVVAVPLPERIKGFVLGTERGRLALGVLVAFVLGFAISSTIAGGMEDGQYSKPLATLSEVYADATTVEAWEALEEVRATTIASMERRRRNIVITSLIVWLLVAGIILFLWLRVANWERFERSPA